jgi:hypothetical protein
MGLYDAGFYSTIREGAIRSAEVVVPLVYQLTKPSTVIDVGGGEGWWAKRFANLGCQATVVDNGDVTAPSGVRLVVADLTEPILSPGRFDLAISLEVAEHLPAARAKSFVRDLCDLAPTVLFSAAIPGQGGAGHVNERPMEYWAELFESFGCRTSGALRWLIWTDSRVENWYRQNLLLATIRPEVAPELFEGTHTRPMTVVHPVLFDARRH